MNSQKDNNLNDSIIINEETHFNDNTKISYESLWKSIIRPPRDIYDESHMGDDIFVYRNKTYIRHDFDLMNYRGNILKLSFLEEDIEQRKNYIMPVVIYLHGNSSSRIEGIRSAAELLKNGINLVVFDFAGCGKSEGDYISLGWYEKEDLRVVCDFIKLRPGVGKIGLWGRSMGAATALLYAYSDKSVNSICVDSPYADFRLLSKQLTSKFISLPNIIMDGIYKIVKNTVSEKAHFDLDKLIPIIYASKTQTPCFFIHAINDDLINYEHTLKLYEAYKGEKYLNVVEGGHNSIRQKHISEKIAKFFITHLVEEKNNKNT